MKIAPDLLEHARPMTDLIPLPDNSRHGDIPALAESLRRFGQRKPIVIDGDNVIIAGNHIFQAAALIDADEIAAIGAADLSVEDRRAYILADNRLSDLGGYDVDLLSAQLATAAEDAAGLLGIGYDQDAIDVLTRTHEAMQAALTDPATEWVGMPAFDQDDLQATVSVTIHFATDDDADTFFELIERPRARSLWWPEPDGHIGSDVSIAYVSDEE